VASNYKVQTQRRTVQSLGGSESLDVMEVGAITIPSSVYFKRAIPYSAWVANSAGELLGPVADAIESRLASDFIAGAIFAQEPDAQGLLAFFIEFTVQIPNDPQQTTTVLVPVDLLAGTDTFQGQIVAGMFQAALTELEATAAL
jgi:hypothetical protein